MSPEFARRRLFVSRQPKRLYAVSDPDAGQLAYLNRVSADIYALFRHYRQSEIEAEVAPAPGGQESSTLGDPFDWGRPGCRRRVTLAQLGDQAVSWLWPILAGRQPWTAPGYLPLPPATRRDTWRAWWGTQLQAQWAARRPPAPRQALRRGGPDGRTHP